MKKVKINLLVACLTVLATLSSCGGGEALEPLALSTPYQQGMVIAKNQPINITGTGNGRIRVTLAGKRARATVADGHWSATLPALKAGGPYTLTVRRGKDTLTLGDVWVGTVILASGQSNMQFRLRESSTPLTDCEADTLLRSFSLPRLEEGEPFTPADGWVRCSADNVGEWSAIGYLVGREIRRRTGEAVGIVNCYQGASVIEAWLPAAVMDNPDYQLPDEETHWDHRNTYYMTWNAPGRLYDLDVKLLGTYPLSHVMWYQGESNTGRGEAKIYPQLMAELIQAWREAFANPTLPFTVVQLADFAPRDDEGWHSIQRAQLTIPTLVDGVSVVPCADVCESNNIHPRTKDKLALRIAATIAPDAKE